MEKPVKSSGSFTPLQRAERKVLRAAKRWFDELKPVTWSEEKHLYAPRCNTTTDAAQALAVAVAKVSILRRDGHAR